MKGGIKEKNESMISIKGLDLLSNCSCKIIINSAIKSRGFFLKINKGKKIYSYFLITHYNNINFNKEIEILLENGNKKIIDLNNKERMIKPLQEYNLICIEILDDDEIKENVNFLFSDLNYQYGYNYYLNKNIVIMNFSNKNDVVLIDDKIKEINFYKKNFKFNNSYDIKEELLGTPILISENKKVVGILSQNEDNKASGIFLGVLIDSIIKNYVKIKPFTINYDILNKFMNSFCIINIKNRGTNFVGFFITLGKKKFLIASIFIYGIIVKVNLETIFLLHLNNGDTYELNFNNKKRIFKLFDCILFIEIFDDEFNNVEFLKVELNYIDINEFIDTDILILFCSSNNITIKLEKMKYINFHKKITEIGNNNNLYFFSSLIISTDNLRVIGILKGAIKESKPIPNEIMNINIKDKLPTLQDCLKTFNDNYDIKSEYTFKEYYGLFLKEIEYELMNEKLNICKGLNYNLRSLNEISKSVCRIMTGYNDSSYINGFFMKIFNEKEQKESFYLISYKFQIISFLIYENNKSFEIEIWNNKKYWIKMKDKDNKRKFSYNSYQGKGIVAIEIYDNDEFKNEINFLYCDLNYENDYKDYIYHDIFILYYNNKNEIEFTSGTIIKIDNQKLHYSTNSSSYSSGAPIILKENSKIIGIHDVNECGYIIGPLLKEIKNPTPNNGIKAFLSCQGKRFDFI